MAKMLKRKSMQGSISDYGKGDPLMEMLRDYYKSTGQWETVVRLDRQNQREQQQKRINNYRRYKNR